MLNDKESLNDYSIRYFIPFLNTVDKDTFKDRIFSHIEFMMKRSGSLIGIIADLINHLNAFEFTNDFVQMITEGIISDDLLVKQDYANDTAKYFQAIA